MDEGSDLHERRFHGGPERLRSPERLALLELPRVVALCVEGISPRSVLDVGTGTGLFAEAFAALGMEATGLDVNAELLALARLQVPSASFFEARAEALPFADSSMDLVFFGLVLHEADAPLAALKEARRVARSRVAVLEWACREEPQGPPLAHRLRPEAIAELAAQEGFSRVESLELRSLVLYRLGS
jgi:ubiquinone/menaquinone biosynthesis C-methylase UbiE